MSSSSSDEMEFRQEDLELAAANSLVGERRKTRAGGARSSKDGPVEVLGESRAPAKVAVPLDASTFHESGKAAASSGASSSSSVERNAAPMGASASSDEQAAASSGARAIPIAPSLCQTDAIKTIRAQNFFEKCKQFWLQYYPIQDIPFKNRKWQAQQMFVENSLRHSLLVQDITTPEEDSGCRPFDVKA